MSFSLPLSSEEMRVALQRGLGRALLQARAFGVKRDRELVLATCLRNPAHDPQCEVDRAHWMVEFLDKELADQFLTRMGHRLISDLRYLCEAHPRSELLEAMMFVYEASTCLNCRGAVIEVIRELEIFPDWAAEEHRYDALTFSSWD